MGAIVIIYLMIGMLVGIKMVKNGYYGRAGKAVALLFYMILWPIFIIFPVR